MLLKYKLIFENQDYLVIYKPAGLLTHSTLKKKEESLADQLLQDFPEIKDVGDYPEERPGIVHRLDKFVSGLLIIARNQETFQYFKQEFKNRKIIKNYLALVYGKIEKEDDTINFPIQRSSKGFKMSALPLINKGFKNEIGREAITNFEVIKKFINFTLLKVNIKTGRTHQIRVHFFAYSHPIVGDTLYYTQKTKRKNEKLALNRFFLIANELEFIDNKQENKKFIIDLDQDLKDFLKEKIR